MFRRLTGSSCRLQRKAQKLERMCSLLVKIPKFVSKCMGWIPVFGFQPKLSVIVDPEVAVMAEVTGFLSPMWEIWVNFLLSCIDPSYGPLWTFGEWTRKCRLCLSGLLNKNHNHNHNHKNSTSEAKIIGATKCDRHIAYNNLASDVLLTC